MFMLAQPGCLHAQEASAGQSQQKTIIQRYKQQGGGYSTVRDADDRASAQNHAVAGVPYYWY
jgi:hypothetical protein